MKGSATELSAGQRMKSGTPIKRITRIDADRYEGGAIA